LKQNEKAVKMANDTHLWVVPLIQTLSIIRKSPLIGAANLSLVHDSKSNGKIRIGRFPVSAAENSQATAAGKAGVSGAWKSFLE